MAADSVRFAALGLSPFVRLDGGWRVGLTGRALASDLESTPNEAADVPAAMSRSLTATGSARAAGDSPACPASRLLLQPGMTTPAGRPLAKAVSHQAPHARRS